MQLLDQCGARRNACMRWVGWVILNFLCWYHGSAGLLLYLSYAYYTNGPAGLGKGCIITYVLKQFTEEGVFSVRFCFGIIGFSSRELVFGPCALIPLAGC